MDQSVVNELKQLLLSEKAQLNKELASVADPDVGDHVPGDYVAKFPNFGDENYLDEGSDTPDEVQAYEVNLAVTGELADRLKKVETALTRMEMGTYGKDIKTGEDIPVERLRANPAAETAIH